MSTKGKWLTIQQKCEIIAQHRRAPATNYTQLAQWAKTRFELSVAPTRQTIRNIVQGAADIEAKRLDASVSAKGRVPSVRSQELEQQLQNFVAECKQHDVQLTRRLLNARAREILDGMDNAPSLQLSVGWLTRFMKRHGLSFRKDKVEEETALEAVTARTEAPVEITTETVTVAEESKEVQEPSTSEQEKDKEDARVNELRQKAMKRLREIEDEANDLRKYLRRLDAAQAHAHT